MSESVPETSAPIRLCQNDLTKVEGTVVFREKEYPMKIQVTAFGECAFKAIDVVNLVSEKSQNSVIDTLKKMSQSHEDFFHAYKLLRSNIKVSPSLILFYLKYIMPF